MANLIDRNGDPFKGDKVALKRHNNKLCKQLARAKADPTVVLPLPPGIAAALDRICKAGGFEDPRELLDLQIRKLDGLLVSDRPLFDQLTLVTVTVGPLEKFYRLLGLDDNVSDE